MDYESIEKITSKVKNESHHIQNIKNELAKAVIGQEKLLERMIITFMSGGHILLEGVPGLAKTLAVKAFARTIKAEFSRVQFTPDLLPADLTGTRIYNPATLDFITRKGPVFTNILLADEINRSPAKVQSALLEAMEEKQVTIGEDTFTMPMPFMVLATENPIEQEGTYPLPEAQLDRFFMKTLIDYPAYAEEREILKRFRDIDIEKIKPVTDTKTLEKLSALADEIYIDDKLIDYIVSIVNLSRNTADETIRNYIEFGASPRASIALMRASKRLAFMNERGFVTPDDIKEIAPDILRHRLILSYEAEADGKSPDDIVKILFNKVEVP